MSSCPQYRLYVRITATRPGPSGCDAGHPSLAILAQMDLTTIFCSLTHFFVYYTYITTFEGTYPSRIPFDHDALRVPDPRPDAGDNVSFATISGDDDGVPGVCAAS